jgi:GT2 family glycosyltransferase
MTTNDFGAEELDVSIRVRAAGFDVQYFPAATANHNSLVRDAGVDKWRRRQWAYNHVLVYYRYFPLVHAMRLSVRKFVSLAASGIRKYGVFFALELGFAMARGAIHGMKTRRKIPDEVVEFYLSPGARAAIGDVSMTGRAFMLLKRRWSSAAP